jgi:hypothetical protein
MCAPRRAKHHRDIIKKSSGGADTPTEIVGQINGPGQVGSLWKWLRRTGIISNPHILDTVTE